MRVRMTVQVSGMRNGAEWPPRGGTIDLPDDEARQYIEANMAVPAGESEPETATAPTADVETRGPLTTQTGPAKRAKRT